MYSKNVTACVCICFNDANIFKTTFSSETSMKMSNKLYRILIAVPLRTISEYWIYSGLTWWNGGLYDHSSETREKENLDECFQNHVVVIAGTNAVSVGYTCSDVSNIWSRHTH